MLINNLTVRQLIEQLQQFKPDEDVRFVMNVGCCGDTELLNVYEIDDVFNVPYILFEAPIFLNSCGKYGHYLNKGGKDEGDT